MASKTYKVSFELWDVTISEERADLLRSEEFEVAPLTDLKEALEAFMDSVEILHSDAPNVKAMRVSMSRNGGTGIIRQRFEFGDRKYRLDTRAERIVQITDAMIEAGVHAINNFPEDFEAHTAELVVSIYKAMHAKA